MNSHVFRKLETPGRDPGYSYCFVLTILTIQESEISDIYEMSHI